MIYSNILMYKTLWEQWWRYGSFSLDNPPGKAYSEGHTKTGPLKSYCVLGTVNSSVIWYIPARTAASNESKKACIESVTSLQHKSASKLTLLETKFLMNENSCQHWIKKVNWETDVLDWLLGKRQPKINVIYKYVTLYIHTNTHTPHTLHSAFYIHKASQEKSKKFQVTKRLNTPIKASTIWLRIIQNLKLSSIIW